MYRHASVVQTRSRVLRGGAVEALTRALAFEIAPKRVNVVSPGIIDTGMFDRFGDNRAEVLERMGHNYPMGRVGHADEVAGAIIHTMTNGYMTGATLDVDGGALLPDKGSGTAHSTRCAFSTSWSNSTPAGPVGGMMKPFSKTSGSLKIFLWSGP